MNLKLQRKNNAVILLTVSSLNIAYL